MTRSICRVIYQIKAGTAGRPRARWTAFSTSTECRKTHLGARAHLTSASDGRMMESIKGSAWPPLMRTALASTRRPHPGRFRGFWFLLSARGRRLLGHPDSDDEVQR